MRERKLLSARRVQPVFGDECDTRSVLSRAVTIVLCAAIAGCATSDHNRAWLDGELRERAGISAGGERPRVVLDDGMDEAEVVALALWNNPALRVEVARIDAALATLDEARRPANPQLTLLAPLGPISAMATLLAPLESLCQMPSRTEAAAREADVAGEAVLMRALDLVRDARLLHVELGLAAERLRVREELAMVAQETARIAAVRASVGEVSRMEEQVLHADALASVDASDLASIEVSIARARLAAQLAIDPPAAEVLRATFATDLTVPPGLRELITVARAARPDARAAEVAISAATARAGFERSRVIAVSAQVEGHWTQPDVLAMRIGGRIELPIFGANPGGIGRAEAEVERATALHEAVARNVVLDVKLAHTRFLQAARSRERFETEVLPAIESALKIARHSFESGDAPYLVVLDVLRRVGEARLRRAELIAEQRRALCELEHAIGARLASVREVADRALRERGGQ